MSNEERRAEILANAQRRAMQASAPSSAPVQNPTVPIQNPAAPVQSPAPQAPERRAPRASSTNKDVQVSVVPKGTTPAQAGALTRGSGTVSVGASSRPPQRSTSPGVTRTAGPRDQGVAQRAVPVESVTRMPSGQGRQGTQSQSVQGQVRQGVQGQVRQGVQGQVRQGTQNPGQIRSSGAAPARVQIQPSNAPVVDCMMLLAYHARPALVETQLRNLFAASVRPVGMVAWVNPSDMAEFPDSVIHMLEQVAPIYAPADMGPWMRWAPVIACASKYVCILDDDCLPGPQWLARAIERLDKAGERDVVVAAGATYRSDDPADLQLLGPESTPPVEVQPDIGRGGWVMRTGTARKIAASEDRYGEIMITGLHVASVIQELGGAHILLPYTADRSSWGMLESPRAENSMSWRHAEAASAGLVETTPEVARATSYIAYRDVGWMPMCVAAALDTVRTDPVPEVAQ